MPLTGISHDRLDRFESIAKKMKNKIKLGQYISDVSMYLACTVECGWVHECIENIEMYYKIETCTLERINKFLCDD